MRTLTQQFPTGDRNVKIYTSRSIKTGTLLTVLLASTWGWHTDQQSTAGHSLWECEAQLERVFDQTDN